MQFKVLPQLKIQNGTIERDTNIVMFMHETLQYLRDKCNKIIKKYNKINKANFNGKFNYNSMKSILQH